MDSWRYADRALRDVAPPLRAALPVFGNRDWQTCGFQGSAGLKPGATRIRPARVVMAAVAHPVTQWAPNDAASGA